MEQEVEFVLSTAGQYLIKPPTRKDVLSVFAGIRPLVRASGVSNTAALSRDHVIHIDSSGLMKWTTYRHMAEDCVDQAATLAQLPDHPCVTHHLSIHGAHNSAKQLGSLSVYGIDAVEIQKLIQEDPHLGERLHPALPYVQAEVIWAVRHEMARTVEDVLARRTRSLFLNARATLEMAPVVANLMGLELDWDESAQASQLEMFRQVARNYLLRE
jgi:glycerol-3-phosphate dehydrogenase